MALRTGLRAARLGVDVTEKGDPDVGELVTACRRLDIPLASVLITE